MWLDLRWSNKLVSLVLAPQGLSAPQASVGFVSKKEPSRCYWNGDVNILSSTNRGRPQHQAGFQEPPDPELRARVRRSERCCLFASKKKQKKDAAWNGESRPSLSYGMSASGAMLETRHLLWDGPEGTCFGASKMRRSGGSAEASRDESASSAAQQRELDAPVACCHRPTHQRPRPPPAIPTGWSYHARP